MDIVIGADHAGWELKEAVARHLKRKGIDVKDFGCANMEEKVDYPDYAQSVAQAVNAQKAALGILCCGTGIGMSIAANKIQGIRAAVVWDKESARLAREHNNANILCLGGRLLDPTKALSLVDAFLEAVPSIEARHQERVKKIHRLEQ